MRMFLRALGSGMMTLGITGLLSACSSTLPREYIDQAEPGLTLTTLAADPATILGESRDPRWRDHRGKGGRRSSVSATEKQAAGSRIISRSVRCRWTGRRPAITG